MTTNVAIITGASHGIGPSIAAVVASAGHPVVLAARTTEELERQADNIARAGGIAVAVTADLTGPTDRQRVIDAARRLGPIGVLVNNAAVGPIAHFHRHSADEIADAVSLNVTAPFDLARLAIADMIGNETPGRIVNIATVAAKLAMPNMALYSATKAALSHLTVALNLEYADHGIRATTVLPGAVAETGMAVRAVEETGVDLANEGAVPPEAVAEAVIAAIGGIKSEIFVGSGSKFMARHQRIAYRLMRRAGLFVSLAQAADAHPVTPTRPSPRPAPIALRTEAGHPG